MIPGLLLPLLLGFGCGSERGGIFYRSLAVAELIERRRFARRSDRRRAGLRGFRDRPLHSTSAESQHAAATQQKEQQQQRNQPPPFLQCACRWRWRPLRVAIQVLKIDCRGRVVDAIERDGEGYRAWRRNIGGATRDFHIGGRARECQDFNHLVTESARNLIGWLQERLFFGCDQLMFSFHVENECVCFVPALQQRYQHHRQGESKRCPG